MRSKAKQIAIMLAAALALAQCGWKPSMPKLSWPWGGDKKETGETASGSPPVVTPIFGQLLAHGLPEGFAPPEEQPAAEGRYLRKSPRIGETTENWTQLVSVSAIEGLGAKTEPTIPEIQKLLVEGIRKKCPESFSFAEGFDAGPGLADTPHSAFVVGCGLTGGGRGNFSEMALIVLIAGASDHYEVEWAEQARPSIRPPAIDRPYWQARLNRLQPLKLCPIVEGEEAPYPSCLGR